MPAQRRLPVAALAFFLGASPCLAEGVGRVEWNVTSDIDGDGMLDRALLVAAPDGLTTDLHVFFRTSDAGPRADAKPDVVKKAVASGTILAFESRERGRLSVTSCTGCSSMSSLEQTLTVVYRGDQFVVGGFTRGWELSRRRTDGNVEVKMGSCSIDYLTGEGRVGKDLDGEKLVKERFKPIALGDWSDKLYPDICKYEGEK